MLRRKELKAKGKKAFYRNWKYCILVCVIYTIFIGGVLFSFQKPNLNYAKDTFKDSIKVLNFKNLQGETNSDIVNEFINGLRGNNPSNNFFFSKATRGFLGTISNNVSKTGSFMFGILNALNQILFKDKVTASIIIIIGAILSLIYWIFVSKVLEVGLCRFFLENKRYTKTKPSKILYPYRLNKTLNVSLAMLRKNIYNILWDFTIVGGFIKYYSYMLVPYILAENPNIKGKDAIKLSQNLMKGYKWDMFKLDLSFILYHLLGIITFNISNLVFTNPYMNATKAEVYLYLRDLGKTKGVEKIKLLSDEALDGEVVFGEYPLYEYNLKETKTKKWLSFNYKRHYSVTDIILIFFIVAIIGFLWETILHLFQTGSFVKRGTLYGPWLPIYGGGAIAVLVLLRKYRDNIFLYFLLTMLVCGTIEYLTSVYLEVVYQAAWWNYNGYFLNLNGRICLEGLLLFGVGSCLVTYILGPIIGNFLDKINKKFKVVICIILVGLIAFDFYASSSNPNSGKGVSSTIENSHLNNLIKDK